MEISARAFITLVHGLFMGGLFILATFAIAFELARSAFTTERTNMTSKEVLFERIFLTATVALGWSAVLLGAYVIYPWYRAIAPAGTINLAAYPQRLLMANRATSGWHEFGMEWKEHIAWLAPMAVTAVAYVMAKYRPILKAYRPLHMAILVFALAAFFCASVAGFFGAMIDKFAPVEGGRAIQLMREQ